MADLMRRQALVDLDLMPVINAPIPAEQLSVNACRNDTVTIEAWKNTWVQNAKRNHENHGPFKNSHVGQLFGQYHQRPVIVAGSGPSLEFSIEPLKVNNSIPLISCLHNFHYFVDHGIKVDYWVTLDGGPITIEEVGEGGALTAEAYWAATENQTLIAFIATHPDLIKNWRGKILWYSSAIPDKFVSDGFAEIEKFQVYVNTGGNVFGAATYIAKAIFGCNPVALIGADFAFSTSGKRFHAWKSKYDGNIGNAIRVNDIFGNQLWTWPSYANFKSWFDAVAINCPGLWVNCTEGGTWGAYPQGVIKDIVYMPLIRYIMMYQIYKEIQWMCEHPDDALKPGDPFIKALF